MRLLCVWLISAVSALAQVPTLGWGTSTTGSSWDGPKTVIAGHQSLYAFYNIRWSVTVTCTSATSRCDTAGSGYTPTGTEGTVYFASTATAPGYVVPPATAGTPLGVITMYGNALATYNICNVSGTTFQLGQAGCTTIRSFADNGTGTLSIMIPRAAHAYITSMATADAGATYTTSSGTMPAGTTYKWYLGDAGGITGAARVSALNHLYSYNSNDQLLLGVNVPSTATPGAYTMTLTVCPNDDGTGSCGTLSWAITVVAPPSLALNVEPASFPALTGLSAWETQMTSASGGAAQWCTKATGVTNPSTIDFTSHVAYYDGFRIFRQIANYTRDSDWNNCSDYMLPQYLSTYIVPNNGNIQGIDVFPDGLTHALNTQSRYAMAMEKIGFVNGQSGVTYILYGGLARANWMREVSYAMGWMNARVKMQGYPIAAKHKLTADALISMLLSAVDGSGRAGYQTFITGLALEALIKWWQITHDPRVPYVVKLVIDDWWTHWDGVTTFSFEYNVAVDGPYCNLGATWFQTDVAGHCAGDHVNQNILNGLMAAPFAWYWRLSGDATYQTRGDAVFNSLMSSAPFSGKEFSQNYRMTFDYVAWRLGRRSPEHNSMW